MPKIQNISGLCQSLPFSELDFFEHYKRSFEISELGRMKKLLPLHEMAKNLGLLREGARTLRGKKPYFSPNGKVALVFLKMYTQLSAPKLLDQLNGNIHYQMFCGVSIDPESPLTNYKLIDDIIGEIADGLKIQQLQDILAKEWKPYMKALDTMYTDATCYESEMRYPTDQKLLWECNEKAYAVMCALCKRLGKSRPRTKYNDVAEANLAYAKQRKHTKPKARKILRRLLNLLGKMLAEIREMVREDGGELTVKEKRIIDIVTRVYRQQHNHFESGDTRESIPNRIVSVAKPYVRPIVRGKEIKSVEFGAKCNNILVDGISFIEKLSFNPFNEGTRLKHCVKMHKRLFGVSVMKLGGDTGYASEENRNYCKENNIQTSFVKRGRPSQEKTETDYVRKELARVRATTMEGSFGTHKEHYSLRRVKARRKTTEIAYIFFGIHAANLVRLAERLAEQQPLADVG